MLVQNGEQIVEDYKGQYNTIKREQYLRLREGLHAKKGGDFAKIIPDFCRKGAGLGLLKYGNFHGSSS